MKQIGRTKIYCTCPLTVLYTVKVQYCMHTGISRKEGRWRCDVLAAKDSTCTTTVASVVP